MFALDNLVRSSVQAAITVLSPELGANLAGGEPGRGGEDLAREEDGSDVQGPIVGREGEMMMACIDEESNSGVTVIHSTVSTKVPSALNVIYRSLAHQLPLISICFILLYDSLCRGTGNDRREHRWQPVSTDQ